MYIYTCQWTYSEGSVDTYIEQMEVTLKKATVNYVFEGKCHAYVELYMYNRRSHLEHVRTYIRTYIMTHQYN